MERNLKMEKENTTLTEIITIYERMQKGRAADAVFRVSNSNTIQDDGSNQVVEDTVPLIPSFNIINTSVSLDPNYPISQQHQYAQQEEQYQQYYQVPTEAAGVGPATTTIEDLINYGSYSSNASLTSSTNSLLHVDPSIINNNPSVPSTLDYFHTLGSGGPQHQYQHQHSQFSTKNEPNETLPIFHNKILDFNKYKYLKPKKYLYFSSLTNLLHSSSLEGLSNNYMELLKSKYYWLNITDPNEADLSILFSSFNVHDLTISDIREGNTEEKIEIFKHYTFISMRLMCDESIKERGQDMDFNILLFKDFVITIHDKQWASITDILGFLNLLCCNAHSILSPDWVLFSIFIELAQDAQFLVDGIGPEINQIRLGSKSLNEMSNVMRRIFDMEFQIYTISKFLKPKMNILRTLKTKCGKRLSKIIIRLLSDIRDDFKEISHDLESLDHILERSQDTFLALVNIEKSREANEMSNVMQRVSEIALVFLPIQMIGGFLGMNVQVPYQDEDSTFYFWAIIGLSFLLGGIMYGVSSCLLNKPMFGKRKSY